MNILAEALNTVIVCPKCHKNFVMDTGSLTCVGCGKRFFVKDGILCLLCDESLRQEQAKEKILREEAARQHNHKSENDILKTVAQHHCIPVMSERAASLRKRFSEDQWLLDVGCGSGYYWRKTRGARLILMDFAINNLLSAKKILGGQTGILFVQADASAMPFKDSVISGIWSVQVTQHFPDNIMRKFMEETKRILNKFSRVELYNLNPSLMHQIIYKLAGRNFHVKGNCGDVTINKFNGTESREMWQTAFPERKVDVGYSELFFHPETRMRPQNNLVLKLDKMVSALPVIASKFARQINITISTL